MAGANDPNEKREKGERRRKGRSKGEIERAKKLPSKKRQERY